MSYSEDFKIFVATIYGEAVGCSEISWKVIAHSIQNRIGFGAWKKWSTTTEIISKTGYDAYKAKTTNYKYAKTQLNDGVIKSSELKKLIAAVEPIFYGLEKDFTGGVVSYYSPKAQASLHKSKPDQYTSDVPSWANDKINHKVSIKGTEKDDFAWFKILRTRLYLTFVNSAAEPLVGSIVDIVFADKERVPMLSGFIVAANGKIKSFEISDNLGARFKVDGVLVKDQKSKEVKIVGDGKNYEAVIVVDHGKGGIKSKTDTHNQQSDPKVPPAKVSTPVTQQDEATPPSDKVEKDQKIDVRFDIRVIDSENKPIPNMSYYLKYKGVHKKHTASADGIEKNIIAKSGEKISIEVSGKDSRQVVDSFTVSNSLTEKTIKFNLHSFEILFINNDSKRPYTNLNLVQTYRGKTKVKKTNSSGKISVKAMPGFALNYKLRDGTNLITIIVDKNKSLRTITINPKTIDKAAKNLANNSERPSQPAIPDTTPSSPEQDKPKPAIGEDNTPKRDKTDTMSADGRPKTVINDHAEAEFTVLTYDKKTNALFNGGSYTIEYKGKKKMHVSGPHGLGKKVHKGDVGEGIKISIIVSGAEVMVFDGKISANMKAIEIKLLKSTSSFNKFIFAQHLRKNSTAKSRGLCAMYVRIAFEAAGGKVEPRPGSAYQYVSVLQKNGFKEISKQNYNPEIGDIYIIDRFGKHIHGHISGFDGTQWISDFKQNGINIYRGIPSINYKVFRLEL